ncbi:hypothetical protein [Fuscovulum blasticum]|uniref:hypothetical protein n=1 Tax=Fuscovulum blasticum TaxID=1075 RepID=UPI000F4EB87B|nr:hypothetical protein [Fuscovulum blasticum]
MRVREVFVNSPSDVSVEVRDRTVKLNFGAGVGLPETLEGRIRDLIPLLLSLLEADDRWSRLSDDAKASRLQAGAAQGLRFDMALAAALRQAELLVAIVDGTESIANHGFPEFADDAPQASDGDL